MHTPTALVAVSAFIVWTVGTAIIGAARYSRFQKLLFEVNAQLPPQEQFSYLGWHGAKYRRLLREYRALYPSGRLIEEMRTLDIAQFLLFATLLGALGLGLLAIPIALLAVSVVYFTYKI